MKTFGPVTVHSMAAACAGSSACGTETTICNMAQFQNTPMYKENTARVHLPTSKALPTPSQD